MIELACPVCLEKFGDTNGCGFCFRYQDGELGEIPDLIPEYLTYDPVYTFELGRYERIAQQGPGNYADYLSTKPKLRSELLEDILAGYEITEFVNIGPGFGALEEITGNLNRLAIDHTPGFLQYIKDRYPEVRCARGLAEHLPLATSETPCLVADCVFQSVVDRESFLCEAARVIRPGGLFLFTIAIGWNYPRRPQNGFDVTQRNEKKVFNRYLAELGFDVTTRYFSLEAEEWRRRRSRGIIHPPPTGLAPADYLIMEAVHE